MISCKDTGTGMLFSIMKQKCHGRSVNNPVPTDTLKNPPGQIMTYNETSYYTIKEFPHNTLGTILIAFVHFPSKMYNSETADKLVRGIKIKADVEMIESVCGHKRTIVIGDFNMNPFEEGMLSAVALHSIPSKRVVKNETRRVSGEDYSMFYNPMWNLLGDDVDPPGTYFYNNSGQINYFWNIFDQVIIRPDLIDSYVPGSLQILTEIGGAKHIKISDHLPIVFDIN